MRGRIFGPPGTGKTTTLIKRANRAVERYGSQNVSVCSLTNASVNEAAGRDSLLDPENVTTLHSRCKRALDAGSPAEAYARDFVDSHPAWFSSEEAMPPTSSLTYMGATPSRPTYMSRANVYRQQLTPIDQWDPSVRTWFEAWSAWCRDTERMDFTGWLEACATDSSPLPRQTVVYVDEAQDHTPLQHEVIDHWPTDHILMVGDDDQCLYDWSGADPYRFYASPAEHEWVLDQSYRVPALVHAFAGDIIYRVANRKLKAYKPRDHKGYLDLSDWSWSDAERGLLPDIEGQTMILATCNYMLGGLVDTLKAEYIPFHNPYRADPMWNPLKNVKHRLEAYLGPDHLLKKNAVEWITTLRQGAFTMNKRSLVKSCKETANHYQDVSEHLKPEVLALARKRDIRVLEQYADSKAPRNWSYLLRMHHLGRNWRDPQVIVGTVHSVKGGEADTVFLTPDVSPSGDPSSDATLRTFYVGATRARERLVLCRPSNYPFIRWN